jgi:hypothetical protein
MDQILGKFPGRLSLLAIGSGVLLGTMIMAFPRIGLWLPGLM